MMFRSAGIVSHPVLAGRFNYQFFPGWLFLEGYLLAESAMSLVDRSQSVFLRQWQRLLPFGIFPGAFFRGGGVASIAQMASSIFN